MLRWYLASLVFLLVISPAVGFGVYHYVMTHPAEPGTLAGRVYEKTVKAKLSRLCMKNMRPFVKADEASLEKQLGASWCTAALIGPCINRLSGPGRSEHQASPSSS